MRQFPRAISLVALATVIAPVASSAESAFRWGVLGHRVVADIALDRLSPAAAEATRRLLGGRSLADVASWADSQRTAAPATGPWHYIDILITDSTYVPERDCKDGACVIVALTNQLALLADRSRTDSVRATALKWVVHLVGDLHQPLHAGERRDRGGNDVKLAFGGRPSNLHSVWDSGLLTSFGLTEEQTARLLEDEISRRTDIAAITGESIVQWVIESHDIARDVVYRNLPATLEITAEYSNAARPVIYEQLLRGGVRLAALLERALGRG